MQSAVQAAAHTDMHWASETGDGSKVKQIKVKIAVVDFIACLSLLTRGVLNDIAMVARVAMAVMYGIPIEDAAQRTWGIKIPWGKGECVCNHCSTNYQN